MESNLKVIYEQKMEHRNLNQGATFKLKQDVVLFVTKTKSKKC